MIRETDFPIFCTGDVCSGDTILFTEAVFGGSHRKPKFLGERRITARVIRDSYGAARQQHTFTIKVLDSDGHSPLTPGTTTTRKGRNVYRNGTQRRAWDDETARTAVLAEKHERGDAARFQRDERRSVKESCL